MSLIPPATSTPCPAAALPPRWVRVRWVARALLGLVAVAWSLLLIAWLTLHWGILPHIQQWREPIQRRASVALGVPVRIGQIEVRSGGWVPSFELRDVTLLDADQRPALRLPRVFAAISPRSLLSLQVHFEQLLIDGPELEIKRDRTGRLFVAGFNVSGTDLDKNQGSDAADWFFAQHEFVIRAGALRWTDEQRDAAPLALTDVQLVVRNSLRHHDVRVDATPPPEWGDRFVVLGRFTQPLLARRGDWQRWSGQAHADLPRADVHALRQHVTLPFELNEGIGAVRGWMDLKDGEPIAATVDVALRAVTLRLGPEIDPLAVQEVQGRVIAQRTAEGGSLAVERVSFLTGDNVRWPEGDMAFSWRQREGQPVSGGEFRAQRIDIGPMAQIAERVPLGDAVRRLLAELKPQGVISGFNARWDGPLDAPAHYRAKGLLSGLSLAARASAEAGGVGRPGLRNATIDLDANEAGGTARLAISNGGIDLPGVFDEPLLPLDQLSAQLLWKIDAAKVAGQAPKVSVQVKNAQFSNPDAHGELTASWSPGAGVGLARGGRYPGRLELDAKLADGLAARAYRYLPLGISRDMRDYVQHAVQGGRLASATFRVKGDLWDFPFYNAKTSKDGEFRITAKIEDARYAFVPSSPASGGSAGHASPWPALAKVDVDLALDLSLIHI